MPRLPVNMTAESANLAARSCVLTHVGVQAGIGHRTSQKVPMGRADAKIAYAAPFVVGLEIAGARMVSIQSRWLVTALTGHTSWPKDLKVSREVRPLLRDDLWWLCLWVAIHVVAIMLFTRARLDPDSLAHTRMTMCVDALAPG